LKRRIILRLVISIIRKYFSDGVSVITDSEEEIIAYKWSWTKELEESICKKRQG
jgi:hypothetical protein